MNGGDTIKIHFFEVSTARDGTSTRVP